MLKKIIPFVDYNGQDRTVEEYFNINKSELIKMQASMPQGIEGEIDRVVKSQDLGQLWEFIESLVHLSYGKKSTDGIHFHKSDDILKDFINSAYYSDFIYSLVDPDNNGAEGQAFITGIFPKDLVDAAQAEMDKLAKGPAEVPTSGPSAREVFTQRTAPEGVIDVNPTVPPAHFDAENPTQAPNNEDAQFQEFLKYKAAQQSNQP